MGFFDKKIQQAQQNAMQQAGQQQQAAMGGAMGGYDPMEAMRQAGMDPNAAMGAAMAADPAAGMAQKQRLDRINANAATGKGTVVSAQNEGVDALSGGQATNMQLQI
ncbi:MAG: hypothetical protein JOY80_02885, partial [Candidatus Dormibacteraeota bacterium]|nr:hypothetical protein [Candidatus Dormibacteraeota bacterium]